MPRYCFQLMARYNIYIEIFTLEKEIIFAELQEIKFSSEYLEAITEIERDFA